MFKFDILLFKTMGACDVIAFRYSGNIGKEASVNKLATEEVTFSAGWEVVGVVLWVSLQRRRVFIVICDGIWFIYFV